MKVLEFKTGKYTDGHGGYCVVGALARATGQRLVGQGIINEDRLRTDLKISDKTINDLIELNDNLDWKRLSNRLRKLELFHLVLPYAQKVVDTETQKQALINA